VSTSTVPELVAVGHVTHDLYGEACVAGGCAYYGARTAHGLGARVGLVTMVGRDFRCADALDGLELSLQREGETTLFINTYRADGVRIQRALARAPAVTPSQLPSGWERAPVIFVAPVMGEVELKAWRAAVSPRVLGIGVQGWIKEATVDGAVVPKPWQVEQELLQGVDAACISEDDYAQQPDLLERLLVAVKVVAFTHGKQGFDVYVQGLLSARVGIFPTAESDPTGAGDVFSAGFFLSLGRGLSPVDAARAGAAAASIIVEGRGGETFPRMPEARARAVQVPLLR
jgi:sugar/nucleoside kinase (ribokinase family)